MEIFWFFAAITALGIIVYWLQILAIRLHSPKQYPSNREGSSLPSSFPPISILKPMRGPDDNLFDNLESFCLLDYPKFETIFCLQDRNDPAYKIAAKIKNKYPDRDISIVVEKCNEGLNPKVNNLMPGYRAAKYRHILISDSNVSVDRYYLKEIAVHMRDFSVGLVTNVIRGDGGHTIGSIFENLHLNSFIIGSVCFLDRFFKMPCVIGKSMLMRKADLEAIGGLSSVKDILAEDYIIGERMHRAGKRVVVSNHMINNVNKYWGIKKFLNRHTRWGKLRWRIGGVKYFSELICNPVFISSLPILLWEPSRITVSFALIVSIIKIIGDLYIGEKIGSKLNPLAYLLSPVKDLIIGFVWFVPILSNTVVWRGNRYVIGKDSRLSRCPESGVWSWRYRIFDAIRARLA